MKSVSFILSVRTFDRTVGRACEQHGYELWLRSIISKLQVDIKIVTIYSYQLGTGQSNFHVIL